MVAHYVQFASKVVNWFRLRKKNLMLFCRFRVKMQEMMSDFQKNFIHRIESTLQIKHQMV